MEWIEIKEKKLTEEQVNVSTLAVEWIEICTSCTIHNHHASPPSRWSGLKFQITLQTSENTSVSTLAVEWIEMILVIAEEEQNSVSTLAVEWIEISKGI